MASKLLKNTYRSKKNVIRSVDRFVEIKAFSVEKIKRLLTLKCRLKLDEVQGKLSL